MNGTGRSGKGERNVMRPSIGKPGRWRYMKMSISQYNEVRKAARLLPPRERLPIMAAEPRLEAMTVRLAGWVALKVILDHFFKF
jgi:hypothetical protein